MVQKKFDSSKRRIVVKKKKRLRRVLLIVTTLLIITGSIWGISMVFPQPPASAIQETSAFLSQAKKAEASRYAPELLKTAEEMFKVVQLEWQTQNQKWFFERDFKNLQALNDKAAQHAEKALNRSIEIRDSLKTLLKFKIVLVAQQIDSTQAEIKDFPAQKSAKNKFSSGELLVLESRAAYERGDYLEADLKLAAGEKLLGEAYQKIAERLEEYLAELPRWRSWAEQSIKWSKANNAPVIIVDKLAKTCQLYVAGKLKTVYTAEFGPNWMGHKSYLGDHATPEGQYHIKKKRNHRETKYYRALEIDYPNQADQENFIAAKKAGKIPVNARIGGLIEIHGEGGKGINWTEGCIALENEYMDELFEIARVGTPVTIVGSLNGLSKENKHIQK